MSFSGANMASENDSYDDFDDSLYDDELLSDNDKQEIQDLNLNQLKHSNLAAWRKIEDFWENYRLNKQINDDPYDDNYNDFLTDEGLN